MPQPNSYQPWQVFTNRAMRTLENELPFLKNVNRDNQYLFAKPGMKSGQSINIRLPARFVGRRGEAYQPEPYVQTSYPANVSPLFGVDIDMPSTDWTLYIDDIEREILQPAMKQLANNIEREFIKQAYKATSNFAGTLGVSPATSTVALQAGAYLTNEGMPVGDQRRMILDPQGHVTMVPALQGLFNPQITISKQYKKGLLAEDTLGWDWYQSQNIVKHQVGPLGGTPAMSATAGQTGSSIATTGWTAAAALRLREGDIIEIAGVYAVNPMTREPYGGLRHFTVTADVYSDGAGAATIPISPAIVPAPGQFATVDTAPGAGALISVFGVAAAGQSAIANTYSSMNIGYHRDAFTFASISQELPNEDGARAWQAVNPDIGVNMRFLRQYQGGPNNFINRFDVLCAFAAPYATQGAVRLLGASNV